MSTRTIEIDLYRDWIAHLRNKLSTYGYDVTQFRTDEQVAHAFLNLLRRLVRPFPRAVLKTKSFSCPADLLPGLAEVERKIAVGDDLSPHLSRFLRSPSFNDPLLNDWGIHHVQLGTVVESDGFVSRIGPVLFARFDNAAAYLIDVLPHGSWSLQSMVKTLHDNWPDSIKHFRLKGVISLERPLTDGDIARLRKANVNTMVQLEEGIIYAPIGGGFATSGLSTDVVIRSDHCARRLRAMQQSIIDNIEVIATDARAKGIELPGKSNSGWKLRTMRYTSSKSIACSEFGLESCERLRPNKALQPTSVRPLHGSRDAAKLGCCSGRFAPGTTGCATAEEDPPT